MKVDEYGIGRRFEREGKYIFMYQTVGGYESKHVVRNPKSEKPYISFCGDRFFLDNEDKAMVAAL